MRTLLLDVHDTLRILARDRSYSATVIVTLALSIGATTAVFSIVNGVLLKPRYQAQLFIVFGVVALGISTLGVYAVTAYGVSRRRREMNIRVALGANRGSVLTLIVKQTSVPVLAGIVGGILVAAALGGTLTSLLYEVQPRDPVITAVAVAIVAGAGLLSALFAARRGIANDPMAALRVE